MPFSRDHQQREAEDAEERGCADLVRRRLEPAFDVLLHVPAGAPHVDDQRGDEHGRDERQNALPRAPDSLARAKRTPAPMLSGNRQRRCPSERRGSGAAARSSEVGQADGDDEKRFQPFPQRHDERLQHDGPVVSGFSGPVWSGECQTYKLRLISFS